MRRSTKSYSSAELQPMRNPSNRDNTPLRNTSQYRFTPNTDEYLSRFFNRCLCCMLACRPRGCIPKTSRNGVMCLIQSILKEGGGDADLVAFSNISYVCTFSITPFSNNKGGSG